MGWTAIAGSRDLCAKAAFRAGEAGGKARVGKVGAGRTGTGKEDEGRKAD